MHFNRLADYYLQAISSFGSQGQQPIASPQAAVPYEIEWSDIRPYSHLEWQRCAVNFQCARLQVPMDWQGSSTEKNRTVEVAVVKLEATVPVTDHTYGGAVVLNPGGPGGSGVGQVLRDGHHVRTLLSAGPDADSATAKNFDVIGFDPRGVNNTTPLLTCFPNHLEAAAFTIQENSYGWVDTSETSFDNLWAGKRAIAEGCSRRGIKEGIAKHMATASVARDIIEIFEQHGVWREKEARRILSLRDGPQISSQERARVLERVVYREGHEKVQYWGFSYGTLLGGTLSAMFPDRIHRALLDGVVDMMDYMAAGWSTNLRDTDRQYALLAEYCFQGGSKNCPLYNTSGPSTILANVQRTMTNLKHNPISVPGNEVHGPSIVTYNDLQEHVWRKVVYYPLTAFPWVAQILSDLAVGNGTSLAAKKRESLPDLGIPLSRKCEKDGPYMPACFQKGSKMDWGATAGIACSDGSSLLNVTKGEYREYADLLVSQSSLIGGDWATIMMPCTAWHARPEWRYEGNFSAATANPLLFIGNTVDPVTPLFNAIMMAKRYEGAGLLHQDSEGHCTTASVSMCTGYAIREYFQSGRLPGKKGGVDGYDGIGAFCTPNHVPLDGYTQDSEAPLPPGETDVELWESLLGLNRAR